MNNYLWSVSFQGQDLTVFDGKILNISFKLSAKKKGTICTIQLSPYAKNLIEDLIKKSKTEGGIKLPASLAEVKKANTDAVSATNGATGNCLPGLEGLPGNSEFSAIADMISFAEGTYPDGYGTLVGGEQITDFSAHPDKVVSGNFDQGSGSTAAGRYQFLTDSWDEAVSSAKANGVDIPDFSPESQNKAVYYWLKQTRSDAFNDAVAGRASEFIRSSGATWESFTKMLNNNYVKTEQQALSIFAERLAVYKAAPTATTVTSTQVIDSPETTETTEQPTKEEQAKALQPETQSCTIRAYLDSIAYVLGTDTQGDTAYTLNVAANGASLVDASKPIGRYKISPAIWNQLKTTEIYDKAGQDAIMVKLLELSDGLTKLTSGDVEGATRQLDRYIPELPQGSSGDAKTLAQFVEFFSKSKDTCLAKEQANIEQTGDSTGTESGGEIIKIKVKTPETEYVYYFYFERLEGYTIYGKSLTSRLENTVPETNETYQGLSEEELAAILLKRNGFNLDLNPDKYKARRNYVISEATDRDTLEKLYQSAQIKYDASGVATAGVTETGIVKPTEEGTSNG